MPYWRLLLFQVLCLLQPIVSEHSLFDGKHGCSHFRPASPTNGKLYLHETSARATSENRRRLNGLRESNNNDFRYEIRDIGPRALQFSEERHRILLGKGIVEQSRRSDNQPLSRTVRDTAQRNYENDRSSLHVVPLVRENRDTSRHYTRKVGDISRNYEEVNMANGDRNTVRGEEWYRRDDIPSRISTATRQLTYKNMVRGLSTDIRNERDHLRNDERYLRNNPSKIMSGFDVRTIHQRQTGQETDRVRNHDHDESSHGRCTFIRDQCNNVRDNARNLRYATIDRTFDSSKHDERQNDARLIAIRNVARTLNRQERSIIRDTEREATIKRSYGLDERHIRQQEARLFIARNIRSHDRLSTIERHERKNIRDIDERDDIVERTLSRANREVRQREARQIRASSLDRHNINSRQEQRNIRENKSDTIERIFGSEEGDVRQRNSRQSIERYIQTRDRMIVSKRQDRRTNKDNERDLRDNIYERTSDIIDRDVHKRHNRPIISRNRISSRDIFNNDRKQIWNIRGNEMYSRDPTSERFSQSIEHDLRQADARLISEKNVDRRFNRFVIKSRRERNTVTNNERDIRYITNVRTADAIELDIRTRDTLPEIDRNIVRSRDVLNIDNRVIRDNKRELRDNMVPTHERLNINNRQERRNVMYNEMYSRDATIERFSHSILRDVHQQNDRQTTDRNMVRGHDRLIINSRQDRRTVKDNERNIKYDTSEYDVRQQDPQQITTRRMVRTPERLNINNRDEPRNFGNNEMYSRYAIIERRSRSVARNMRRENDRQTNEKNIVHSDDRRNSRQERRTVKNNERYLKDDTRLKTFRTIELDVRQQDSQPTNVRNMVRTYERLNINNRQEPRNVRNNNMYSRDSIIERKSYSVARDILQQDDLQITDRNMVRSEDRLTVNSRQERNTVKDNEKDLRDDTRLKKSRTIELDVRQKDSRPITARNMVRTYERRNMNSMQELRNVRNNERYSKDSRYATNERISRSVERNVDQQDSARNMVRDNYRLDTVSKRERSIVRDNERYLGENTIERISNTENRDVHHQDSRDNRMNVNIRSRKQYRDIEDNGRHLRETNSESLTLAIRRQDSKRLSDKHMAPVRSGLRYIRDERIRSNEQNDRSDAIYRRTDESRVRQQNDRNTMDRNAARDRDVQYRVSSSDKDVTVDILRSTNNLNRHQRLVVNLQKFQRLQNNIRYSKSDVSRKEVRVWAANNPMTIMKPDLSEENRAIRSAIGVSGNKEYHPDNENYSSLMYWQYLLYALQGVYIYGVFTQMLHNDGNVGKRSSGWIGARHLIKID